MSVHELDARRLICPMPVIRTQDRIKQLAPGDRLVVTCSDPGARNDIPAWCRINGHTVIGITGGDTELTIEIEVGDDA